MSNNEPLNNGKSTLGTPEVTASATGSVTAKLAHDATASVSGTFYQIGVAVLQCWKMTKGQKVLIEKLGDVSVEGVSQIETKLYSDNLTDGHINLWKTIANWLQEGFDPAAYSSLILYTNQPLGSRGTLGEWNSATAEKRIQILRDIRDRMKSNADWDASADGSKSSSKVLRFQEAVLDLKNRQKLTHVVERFHIEHGSPDLPGIHSLIKERFIKGIPGGNIDSYFDAIVGFVVRPTFEEVSWEISYEDFSKQVGSLNTIYCRETRVFPQKYFSGAGAPSGELVSQHIEHRFVEQLKSIEHHEVIPIAVRDYVSSLKTVREEFGNYEVPPSRAETYSNELLEKFKARYRVACRNCTNIIPNSQNFYDTFTSEAPHAFVGFEVPPVAFRNGILHSQMDDEKLGLKWKVGDT